MANNKIHLWEIPYEIIIEGESYPRTIQFPGRSAEEAKQRWEEQRHRHNDFAEYRIGTPSLIR